MPQLSRQDLVLLSKLACQWVSFMHSGRNQDAKRMLAPDCGLLGIQTSKHSQVYLPMLSLKWLPRLIVRRVYAAENSVSLHVALADIESATQFYQVYFRFRCAKITKVDLSVLLDDSASLLEESLFELPLGEVIFAKL